MIPSHLINLYCRKSLKFHSCLSFVRKLLVKFLKFCRNILCQRSSFLFASSKLPSCILLNFLWCNKDILIEKSPSFFDIFLTKTETLSTNYFIAMEMLNRLTMYFYCWQSITPKSLSYWKTHYLVLGN